MKIHSVLFGFIAAATGLGATMGVVPQAQAASYSTSCYPTGGGWYSCTQKFCHEGQCVVTDSWSEFRKEAITFD